MTSAPVAGTLTVVVPMFRLARGLRLSSFRREWLVKDVVFFPTVDTAVTAFRTGTGADWTPAVQPEAGPATAGPTART